MPALKPMEQPFKCKYCGTKFHKESTLSTHMCVKKRRHMDINTAGSRFGFLTFRKFYDLTVNSKKSKTEQEFIDSPYYIDFVKFGNHLALLKPLYIEQFINFVIMNGIKLKDWTKDYVYNTYLEDLVKKEPATAALERSILSMSEWCDTNGTQFSSFFADISANEAAFMISTGKLSPWVLYLATSADSLMSRFSEDHAKMIGNIIEPAIWMKKFKTNPDDVEYVRSLLIEAGL